MQVKKEFKTFEKNKRVIQKDGRQVCDTLLRPTEDRKRGADVNNLGAKLVGLGKNCGYAVDVHSIESKRELETPRLYSMESMEPATHMTGHLTLGISHGSASSMRVDGQRRVAPGCRRK